jgi:hypothetical protein
MENIYNPNDKFDFEKLHLTKPTAIAGGNYFIRFLLNDEHLYIQPPKCSLKQGIVKAGKRMYADLMFTNENDQFIRWMENLENYCQQYIYKNREQWFDGEIEMHDIENYFTSPLKLYKSGKYYIARINITTALGKSLVKIYDENENEIEIENINENMNVMTILEVQGIKCSARSFQIDIELKQMMVLKPVNLFEKCLFSPKKSIAHEDEAVSSIVPIANDNESVHDNKRNEETSSLSLVNSNDGIKEVQTEELRETEIIIENKAETNINNDNEDMVIHPIIQEKLTEEIPKKDIKRTDGLEEIEFTLEELPPEEIVQIKNKNEVYYEMYREARRKAKIARNLALSSYLEAKRIKNTYMLDNMKDSDDSDLDMEDILSNEEKYLEK